jgi:hypothetical protein
MTDLGCKLFRKGNEKSTRVDLPKVLFRDLRRLWMSLKLLVAVDTDAGQQSCFLDHGMNDRLGGWWLPKLLDRSYRYKRYGTESTTAPHRPPIRKGARIALLDVEWFRDNERSKARQIILLTLS